MKLTAKTIAGLDNPKLYVTSGDATKPGYNEITVGGDGAANGPVNKGLNPLPAPGTSVVYDEASQMIHILGKAPDATDAGPWTVYVVEPHGNAVFADARCIRPRTASSSSCSTRTGRRRRSTRDPTPSHGGCPA